MKKVPAWAWVVAIGVVLFLPRLGSFGLWEPYEIKFADWARGLTEGHALPPGHPPLAALVAAAGMKIGGTSEWAARLPEALCGILGLLAIYYAASGLFSRRAGLIAAAVVAVTPSYLLQSRSLASDIATVAAIALAMGGFGRFVLERKPIHAVAGTVGVALASLGAGWLVGVLAPAAALLC